MKNVLLLLVFIVLSGTDHLMAQCNFPAPPSSYNCEDAPLICEGIDGYCSTLPVPVSPRIFPGCSNSVVSNDHYIKFIASSDFLSITINPLNCTIGNNGGLGIQAGLYSDCQYSNILATACGTNSVDPLNLTAVVEIGQTYYLLIDGYNSSICDYTITIDEGNTEAPNLAGLFPGIYGPDFLINNTVYDFSADLLPGVTDYHWTVTGGTIIENNGDNIRVEITDDTTFEICLSFSNDCSQSETVCQVFDIVPDLQVIEETICEGECFEINNSLFCDPGTYDLAIDNGTEIEYYRLILTVTSTIETEFDEYICVGTCYDLAGIPFCQTGTYTVTLIAQTGCDSIVTLNLFVLNENEPVIAIENSGDLDCENTTSTLNASVNIPGATYQWSGLGIDASNENLQSPVVNLPGTYTVVVTVGTACTASAFTVVSGIPGPPEIEIEGNNPLNCNNHENTIIITGAIAGLEYEWFGPNAYQENGPEVNINEAGEYILVVTTPFGCIDTTIVNVEENNDPLFVDPGPNRHIQCEFILTLNAPGAVGTNVIYEWTTLDGNILNGANTLNPVINQGGTYTLTATDLSNGCTGSADMIVYSDMAIIEEQYLSLTCDVPVIQIDGTESYNGPDAFIQWSTNNGNIVEGGNTLTPTVDAGGVYQLLITRPGCLSFATVTVLDNTTLPALEIEATANAIFCENPVVLEAVTNAVPAVFVWYQDGVQIASSSTLTTNEPGTYTVEVTNDFGCVSSSIIVLENIQDPESVSIQGDLTLDCTLNGVGIIEAIVTGNALLYEYNWFALNGGEFIVGQTSSNPTILGGGTYCVEVSNPTTGCTIIECVDVIEVSDIEVDATIVGVTCPDANDGLIQLQVSGGTAPYIYNWSNGQTAQTITDLSPGAYTVSIIDINNCVYSEQFIVEVVGTNDVIAEAGEDTYLDCEANFIVLDGGSSVFPPGTFIEWTTNDGEILDGENTLFPSVSSTGTYLLTIYDPSGCSDSDEVEVVGLEASASTGGSWLTCIVAEIELEASASVQDNISFFWFTDDGNIVNDANTANPTVNAPGVYTLIVTDTLNGCNDSSSVIVQGFFDEPVLSIEDEEVFITACNGTATLMVTSNVDASYLWTNSNGVDIGDESTITVDQDGIYTVVVTSNFNGCSSSGEVTVIDNSVLPEINIERPTQYINCFNGNPLLVEISITANSNDYTVDWSTDNGNIVSEVGDLINVDQAGNYEVMVTDNENACTATASVEVEAEEGVIEIETTIASCGIADATAQVMTTYIHDPEYLWSTGATTAQAENLAPGIYTVTISAQNAICEEVRTVEIIQDPSCFVIISGYLYDDAALTCDLNGNISPKEGVLIRTSPEDLETLTDENGYYEFLVPPGDHTIIPELVSPFVVECPAESITVSVPPGSSGSENNNFFIKALSGFDLYVTASSGAANAGSNQFYQISYCNNWFTTIFGTVVFRHDPLLEFDPVAAGASSYDPETYTAVWEFEDLSFFECEFLSFSLFIPDDVPDGTMLSSTVTILPTQGDIAPTNNTTSWSRRVNNSTNTSMIHPSEGIAIEHQLEKTFVKEVKLYPNPFDAQTTISFILENEDKVEVQIFDATGRFIKSYNSFQEGYNQLLVRSEELPSSGMYFYKIINTKEILYSGRMIKR